MADVIPSMRSAELEDFRLRSAESGHSARPGLGLLTKVLLLYVSRLHFHVSRLPEWRCPAKTDCSMMKQTSQRRAPHHAVDKDYITTAFL